MDNILYIGPYRELSGMGNAARQYIKAIMRSGHNLSIRPIYNLFKPYPDIDIDNEILELENNSSKSYHKVIQHCYPHQLTFDKRFDHNIGIVHLESFSYSPNHMIRQYTDTMDKIIVGSNFVQKALVYAGLKSSKIQIIPEPIDLQFIQKYREQIDTDNKKSSFSFYVISDFIDRKNLEKIIMAYSLYFHDNHDVDLIIKLKNFSNTDIHIGESIDYFISKIYRVLKRNYVKKPKIILGDVKYESIMYLHKNNNCFINASSGESFGYTTLEALAFNNNIIVNDKIGSAEILSEGCGLLTKTKEINCKDEDRLYDQYNTLDNIWYDPDMDSLMNNMVRATYETKQEKQNRIEAQNIQLQNFSIDTISKFFNNI